jgi:hypothetical protein
VDRIVKVRGVNDRAIVTSIGVSVRTRGNTAHAALRPIVHHILPLLMAAAVLKTPGGYPCCQLANEQAWLVPQHEWERPDRLTARQEGLQQLRALAASDLPASQVALCAFDASHMNRMPDAHADCSVYS